MRSCGSTILNLCSVMRPWTFWILNFGFIIGSCRPWILIFCFVLGSWGSYIHDFYFVVGYWGSCFFFANRFFIRSCRSCIFKLYSAIASCGFGILIFGYVTCLPSSTGTWLKPNLWGKNFIVPSSRQNRRLKSNPFYNDFWHIWEHIVKIRRYIYDDHFSYLGNVYSKND